MERTTKPKRLQKVNKVNKTNTAKKASSQKTEKPPITKHSIWLPFWIGLFIFIIPIAVMLLLGAKPNARVCESSTNCTNMITYAAGTAIATPFILYGAALSITGLCYAIASRRSTTSHLVRPFLWSLVLFTIFGLIMCLVMMNVYK